MPRWFDRLLARTGLVKSLRADLEDTRAACNSYREQMVEYRERFLHLRKEFIDAQRSLSSLR